MGRQKQAQPTRGNMNELPALIQNQGSILAASSDSVFDTAVIQKTPLEMAYCPSSLNMQSHTAEKQTRPRIYPTPDLTPPTHLYHEFEEDGQSQKEKQSTQVELFARNEHLAKGNDIRQALVTGLISRPGDYNPDNSVPQADQTKSPDLVNLRQYLAPYVQHDWRRAAIDQIATGWKNGAHDHIGYHGVIVKYGNAQYIDDCLRRACRWVIATSKYKTLASVAQEYNTRYPLWPREWQNVLYAAFNDKPLDFEVEPVPSMTEFESGVSATNASKSTRKPNPKKRKAEPIHRSTASKSPPRLKLTVKVERPNKRQKLDEEYGESEAEASEAEAAVTPQPKRVRKQPPSGKRAGSIEHTRTSPSKPIGGTDALNTMAKYFLNSETDESKDAYQKLEWAVVPPPNQRMSCAELIRYNRSESEPAAGVGYKDDGHGADLHPAERALAVEASMSYAQYRCQKARLFIGFATVVEQSARDSKFHKKMNKTQVQMFGNVDVKKMSCLRANYEEWDWLDESIFTPEYRLECLRKVAEFEIKHGRNPNAFKEHGQNKWIVSLNNEDAA